MQSTAPFGKIFPIHPLKPQLMNSDVPFDHHGISGGIHVTLRSGQNLDDLCMQYIDGYNPDRFEAVAVRLFAGRETIVTVYALDKTRQDNSSNPEAKLPVKKFKLEYLSVKELFDFFEEFNFTLSSGNYNLEDIEVINK
jgi:hypothetical protein